MTVSVSLRSLRGQYAQYILHVRNYYQHQGGVLAMVSRSPILVNTITFASQVWLYCPLSSMLRSRVLNPAITKITTNCRVMCV